MGAEMSVGHMCNPIKWNSPWQAVAMVQRKRSSRSIITWTVCKRNSGNAHQVLIDSNQRITLESLHKQFIGKADKKSLSHAII
jgi:hypothetical protein